ncbi:nucleic-acid-binding protein from transposon X-element [Trichonephila clavipes]|nr:nucleic-acid-binding protein from transposon X-element [Trichonephila clavipes]
MENPTEMELVNASLPSSRSSTPSLTNCERLQMVQQDLKKFSIMLSNVSHTIERIAPITSDDDPNLAALYSRQAYFDERQQQALEFPELPKKISSKRKESEDGFISPTAKQTFKRQQIEFRNFEIDINNRFEKINENDENIAGNSQNTINFAPPKTTETDKSNTHPPPVFLKLEKHYMEQLKTLNEIIPTLRSKKTGELIKLYTNNSHDYELLQDAVEKLKYQFFIIKPKNEWPIKVVVKGLPKDTETRDIHQNLIELRFTVDKVTQLVGKITKQPLPVFLINLPRNIHNLKNISPNTTLLPYEKYSPNLILIQETHLRPKHNINIPNYICYRNDRDTDENAYGGTLILIRRNIPHYNLPTPPLQHIEATIVVLTPQLQSHFYYFRLHPA